VKLRNVEVQWWAEVDEPGFVAITFKLGEVVVSSAVPAEAAAALGTGLRNAARRAKVDPSPSRKRVARLLKAVRK
jgi:hypothetical protein